MKFNEKELGFFASNDGTVVTKASYLLRKSDRAKDGFRQRWFVLKGNLLFYFRSEVTLNEQPLGCVVLERVCVTESDVAGAGPRMSYGFQIEFGATTGVEVLAAPDAESRQSWMEALKTASYEHLRSVLLELQKKLVQLTGRDPLRQAMEGVTHPQVESKEPVSAAAKLDNANAGSIAARSASIRASVSSRRTKKRPSAESLFAQPAGNQESSNTLTVPQTNTPARPPPPSSATSDDTQVSMRRGGHARSMTATNIDLTLGKEDLKLDPQDTCSVAVSILYPASSKWTPLITTEHITNDTPGFVTAVNFSFRGSPRDTKLRFHVFRHVAEAEQEHEENEAFEAEAAASAAAAEEDETTNEQPPEEAQCILIGTAECSLKEVFETQPILKLRLVSEGTGEYAGILTVDETDEDVEEPVVVVDEDAATHLVRSQSEVPTKATSKDIKRVSSSFRPSATGNMLAAAKAAGRVGPPRPLVLGTLHKRSYRFPTLDQTANLKVTELMIESPFIFAVPFNLLHLFVEEDQALVRDLADLGRLLGVVEHVRDVTMKRTMERLALYTEHMTYIDTYEEATFKPSTKKKDAKLEMLTTNCHVQAIRVSRETIKEKRPSSSAGPIKPDTYTAVTLGIPAAHAMGFKHGGLRHIMEAQAAAIEHAQPPLIFSTPDQVRMEINELRRLEAKLDSKREKMLQKIAEGDKSVTTLQPLLSSIERYSTDLSEFLQRPEISKSIAKGSDYRPPRTTSAVSATSHSIGIQSKDLLASVSDAVHSLSDAVMALAEIPKDGELEKAALESIALFRQATRQACLETLECLRIMELLFEHHYPWPQDLVHRRDIVFAQGLGALVTVFVTEAKERIKDVDYWKQLEEIGFLSQMESLLSTYADEEHMIEDFTTIIEDLNRVEFKFAKAPGSLYEVFISGHRGHVTVTIGLSPSMLQHLPPSLQTSKGSISNRVVLFTQGVNEMQTLANKLGDTELQDVINLEHADMLDDYIDKFKRFYQRYTPAEAPDLTKIDKLRQSLRKSIRAKKPKNVDILITAAALVRALKGGRMTCCKSGKDRTSMSVTLEQCNILIDKYGMVHSVLQHALDAMRSVGTRRENVNKNIGEKRYAFNKLQVFSLPKQYRPPIGTFGSTIT